VVVWWWLGLIHLQAYSFTSLEVDVGFRLRPQVWLLSKNFLWADKVFPLLYDMWLVPRGSVPRWPGRSDFYFQNLSSFKEAGDEKLLYFQMQWVLAPLYLAAHSLAYLFSLAFYHRWWEKSGGSFNSLPNISSVRALKLVKHPSHFPRHYRQHCCHASRHSLPSTPFPPASHCFSLTSLEPWLTASFWLSWHPLKLTRFLPKVSPTFPHFCSLLGPKDNATYLRVLSQQCPTSRC
jgi:hypothetical protein